jgi:tRNA threonylcarbamoyladenosine biosynthesis protein TsaE
MRRGPTTKKPASKWAGRDRRPAAEEETLRIGAALGRSLTGGEIILLEGELGAGKTVLARGIASGLGVDPAEVGSPTFIIVDRHRGRLTLYHADLYRLDREEEMFDLALDELAGEDAALVIEWGERLPAPLREGAIEVRIVDLGDDTRRITIVTPS